MRKFFCAIVLIALLQILNIRVSEAQTVVTYSTAGNFTWTPPVGTTSFRVEVWGGGAAGNASFGGGGGSYARSSLLSVTQSSYNLSVGAGGITSGANGTFSWFGCSSGCFYGLVAGGGLANGGNPSAISSPPLEAYFLGGKGGAICNANGNWAGGSGGSSASPTSNGINGNPGNCAGVNGQGGFPVTISGGGTGERGSSGLGGSGTDGGAPGGGGGAANNCCGGVVGKGATGKIVITYSCGTTGSIGNPHTVPYPWEGNNGTITSTANATGFGVVYDWQQSTDNTNWVTATGSTNSATYTIPEISTNTYYRRRTNIACGSANISNSVLIKVFTAANVQANFPSKNGKIKGYVRSISGAGVAGITVQAKKNISLLGSPASYTYSVVTDNQGKYQFDNIFYGDKDNGDSVIVNFTITPVKLNHTFTPVSYSPQPLSFSSFDVTDGPVFTDLTVFTISGTVFQKCSGCLNSSDVTVNTIQSGVDNASITGGDVPVLTDASGNYAATAVNPGIKTFTPNYKNKHIFIPVSSTQDVQDNITGLNFEDSSTYTISGKLAASVNGIYGDDYIGQAVLEFTDSVAGTSNYTFRKRVTTEAGTGEYSITLPARKYRVRVVQFAPSDHETDAAYVDPQELGNFFNNLAPKDSVFANIDTSSKLLNLIYHRKPTLYLVGLTDTCGGYGVPFRQNVLKTFRVEVYEGPLSKNYKVPTNDTSTNPIYLHINDSLRIYTDVTDFSGTAPPTNLKYRMNQGMVTVSVTPGVPNIASPFGKIFEIHFIDKYGRTADSTKKCIVTGIQSPPQTFTTTAPEIPTVILHRPPGDLSYSYWESTQTIETATRLSVSKAAETSVFREVKIGAKFSTGIGVQVETEVVGSINGSLSTTATNKTDDEITYTNSTTTRYQTRDGGILGLEGDVYIGGAINYKYGVSNVVEFANGCVVELNERLIVAPDGYDTKFTYSESHIKNTLIPALQYFVEHLSNPDSIRYYNNQKKVWEQVIENNNNQKRNASFVQNRSFDGGAGPIDESITNSKTTSQVIEFDLEISPAVAAEIGAEINGSGIKQGVTVAFKMENGKSNSNSNTSLTTTGYHLGDGDLGDYYSVDIKKDPVYGTPVFNLVAGTSSCPPEPGAQSRDNCQLIIENPVINNIPLNGTAFYTLKAVNKSESRETRSYKLRLNNTNADGLTIMRGSQPLDGNGFVPVDNLAYLDMDRNITIAVSKSNPNDNINLSYPNIEFVLEDVCEGGVRATNTITANFVSPCGSINLEGPTEGWVVSADDDNSLPVTFDNYTYSSLANVTLQYTKPGGAWTNGFTLSNFQVDADGSTTYPWNISSLTDSIYKLRLKLVCTSGSIIYTPYINGLIDRKAPLLFGKPQPTDDHYVTGDEISYSYSENIKTSNLGNNIEMYRVSNNSIIPFSVSGYENKIVIVPLANISAFNGDSIMVIVKSIEDIYGNIKTQPDTIKFGIGTAPVVTNAPPVKVYVTTPTMLENGLDTMRVHFKLPSITQHPVKVYYNISGAAGYESDYIVKSDTIYIRVRNHTTNLYTLQPAYSMFNGSQGYIYIDSLRSEAILKIKPIGDNDVEQHEHVTITLSSAADYTLTDSVEVSATIMNDDIPAPIIIADNSTNLCPGSSVTLTAIPAQPRFASSVTAFSTEYSAPPYGFSTDAILGPPTWYPAYGDVGFNWASLNPDDPREFLQLAYNDPAPINFIDIYETYKPGSVDTVYVKNPNTGLFETVYTATASVQPDISRILHISFPTTSFPVTEIRIAMNSAAVPDWNEIDAVSIGLDGTAGTYSYAWSDGTIAPSITVSTAGSYSCTVTNTNTGSQATSETVTVTEVPVQTPVITASGSLNICTGSSVTLSVDSIESVRYAATVTGVSSEYSAPPNSFASTQALGVPDVYPAYGDVGYNWASLNGDDPREFIQLGYTDPAPINFIDIYETYKPGSVDTVYVKNPNTGLFEIVYSATASVQPDVSRILHITFPTTSFPVSEIRIAMNSAAVPDWNEIDAVSIGLLNASYLWSTGETTSGIDVTTAGNYTVTLINSRGCSATSLPVSVTVNPCASFTTLNLNLFLEGFYSAPQTMRSNLYDLGISTDPSETDTVLVNLWSPENLQDPAFSLHAVLHTNGTASVQFPAAVRGHAYYIAVKHRNHMETWSHDPVTFIETTGYDFSTALAQAYDDGVNPPMASVAGGKFAFYGGDVNQDGTVDGSDANDIEIGANNFDYGYNAADANGDGETGGQDANIVEINANLFLFYARPY